MSEEKAVIKSPQTGRPTPKKGPEKVIYLGPTVVDGAFSLRNGAIYSNGLPPNVAQRVESEPDLAKLFFPVVKAPKVMTDLLNPNSNVAMLSNKVKNTYLGLRAKKAS